ncbi:MAG: hypothetical protein ABI780_06680 [Ardenticatenales bacterium]
MFASSALADGPTNLSQTVGPSEDPSVAVRGADALVVWSEGEQLWFARRIAGAWLPAASLPGASGASPAVAVRSDGAYHVVWSGFSLVDDNFEIFSSTLAQGAWSLPENLSGTTTDSIGPAIAARDDGGLFVVWTELTADGPQIVAASKPAGAGWSSGPVPDAQGQDPAVAASGADWHLAWSQVIEPEQPAEIVYARRTAAGWSLPEVVSSSVPVTSSDAAMAVDAAGMPAIAWLEGDGAIAFSRRLADGWTEPRTLVEAALGTLGSPALAMTDGRISVAWARQTAIDVLGDVEGAPEAVATAMTFARRARGAALASDGDGFLVVAEGREGSDAGDIYAVAVGAVAAPTTTPTASATDATTSVAPTTVTPSATPTPDATGVGTEAPTATRGATTPTSETPPPTGTAKGTATELAPTPVTTPGGPTASPTAGTPVGSATPGGATPTGGGGGLIYLPYVVRIVRPVR